MTPVFTVAIVFTFVLLIVKMGMEHSERMKGGAPPENSLRVGELKRLIRDAVEEANHPLERRIEELEARLEQAGSLRPSAPTGSERDPQPAREEPFLSNR